MYGDFTGYPPLLLHAGEIEVLLDDAVQLHARAKAANVDVRLEIFPNMIHVFPVVAPFIVESRKAHRDIEAFIHKHTYHRPQSILSLNTNEG